MSAMANMTSAAESGVGMLFGDEILVAPLASFVQNMLHVGQQSTPDSLALPRPVATTRASTECHIQWLYLAAKGCKIKLIEAD